MKKDWKRRLKSLAQTHPQIHRSLVEEELILSPSTGTGNTPVDGSQIPDSGPVLSPPSSDFRATTFVYFGVGDGLRACLERLNGENNILVLDADRMAFAQLIFSLSNLKNVREDRVQWIHSVEGLQRLDTDFLLGTLKMVNLTADKKNRFNLSALRFLREVSQRRAQSRATSEVTYLTMVTYDRLSFTQLTLERLALNTSQPFRLVIVDNHSSDGTREWLSHNRTEFPFIEKIFYLDDNLGIGRALNNGMLYALARSTKIGRIDNDVLVPPDWLEDLATVLHSELRPYVVGGFVTDDATARQQAAKGTKLSVEDLRVYEVEYAGGCLNLYPESIFAELGFFPEFPLYGVEDGGLCRAARAAGHKVLVVDNVKVVHLPSQFQEESPYVRFKREQLGLFRESQKGAKDGEHACNLKGASFRSE